MGATRGKTLAGIAALSVLPLLGLLPSSAAATPEVDTAVEQDPKTLAARRHFQSGIRRYRDANYAGALAEFEAAYREKPGPGSLQTVALSLKALFRYAEASEALRLLLDRHSAELGDGEGTAVRDAITELEGLVGTLRVQLNPSSASVSVNGR